MKKYTYEIDDFEDPNKDILFYASKNGGCVGEEDEVASITNIECNALEGTCSMYELIGYDYQDIAKAISIVGEEIVIKAYNDFLKSTSECKCVIYNSNYKRSGPAEEFLRKLGFCYHFSYTGNRRRDVHTYFKKK